MCHFLAPVGWATGNDVQKLHGLVFAHYCGAVLVQEVLCSILQAIAQLTDDEQKVIHQFFLSPKPVSELEYGKVNGISQQAANKRKKAVLKKLKKILCE